MTEMDTQKQKADTPDPYQKLCQAMEPGLLITVNCSDPSITGIDEMEVLGVNHDTGKLRLEHHNGRRFIIKHDDREYGTAIIEISETEFTPVHDPVTTIEVIGIDR